MTATARLPETGAQGICVSLGTDAGNNSNLLETMRAMYLAAVLYKDARGTTDVVPAELALELATLHGARALGLDGDIGSLEAGKKADLVLFDTRRPAWSAHVPLPRDVARMRALDLHQPPIRIARVGTHPSDLSVDQYLLLPPASRTSP